MQVVLLERIAKLGQMGDVVAVKPGYARNFLLPQGKALRATKANLERFEKDRAQLEARNLELKKEAEAVHEKLEGQRFVVIRSAGDTGQLYGSVSPRDIADAVTAGGFSVGRQQVLLEKPIKTLGLHEVKVQLHPEVALELLDCLGHRRLRHRQRLRRGLLPRKAFDILIASANQTLAQLFVLTQAQHGVGNGVHVGWVYQQSRVAGNFG